MREGWKEVTIGDLGQVVTGNTPPRKQPGLYGNHSLFVKATDIEVGKKYCFSPEECYSKLGYDKYIKSYIPKDSTCVVTIGSIGKKIIKAHTGLFINQAMNAVIPTELYDEDFVYYLLKLNLFQLKIFDSGTASGRENVSKSTFSKIKLQVPDSKGTQRRIATILSSYDDLIENNLKRIKLLEEKAQHTYEEWFVRMRFPGHETADFDKVSGLPLGWEMVTLKELCSLVTDGTHDSPKQAQVGYKLITGKNINSGFIDFDNAYLISEEDHQKIKKRSSLSKGDILFSNIGTLGNTAIVTEDFEYSCKNVIIFKYKEGYASFLYYYLTNERTQKLLENHSSGVAQKFYSLSFIRNHKDVFPSQYLINEFEMNVSGIVQLKYNLQKQNQLLKEARDILLPRLMSGMVEV